MSNDTAVFPNLLIPCLWTGLDGDDYESRTVVVDVSAIGLTRHNRLDQSSREK